MTARLSDVYTGPSTGTAYYFNVPCRRTASLQHVLHSFATTGLRHCSSTTWRISRH